MDKVCTYLHTYSSCYAHVWSISECSRISELEVYSTYRSWTATVDVSFVVVW